MSAAVAKVGVRKRPIIFSAPMVRAILAGTKSQTRRVVKSPHVGELDAFVFDAERGEWEGGIRGDGGNLAHGEWVRCPFGATGDRLWVRETWALLTGNGHRIVYRADADPPMTCGGTEPVRNMKWTPSIYMRRHHSRITLEVTGVRVERLQAISEEDAIAEGITGPHHVGYPAFRVPEDSKPRYSTARAAFEHLWDSINGDRAPWSANPWVWVVSFRRVQT